jgi:hypothetical protein
MGLRQLPQVPENALDQRRVLDARDHLEPPAAALAALDLDGKHALEPLAAAQVPENPVNERRLLDAGDDAQPAAALPAGLDVDGEQPFQALGPGEAPLALGGRYRTGLVGRSGPDPGHNLGPVGARRGEHAVVSDQVGRVPTFFYMLPRNARDLVRAE